MLSHDDKIIAEGSVTGPPELEEIVAKLTEAADRKIHLLLSPGEVRVLVLYLK